MTNERIVEALARANLDATEDASQELYPDEPSDRWTLETLKPEERTGLLTAVGMLLDRGVVLPGPALEVWM